MKNVKKLCLIAALGVIATTGGLLPSTTAHAATTYKVTSASELKTALGKVSSGDTINISGTIAYGTLKLPSGVNLTGTSGASKLNFAETQSSSAKGLVVAGSGSTISNLEIYNAGDNGIYMEGSSNTLSNLKVHNNGDAGVQLSNGAASNTLKYVDSYKNADSTGENADGFAIKLHSGTGNKLYNCNAYNNSDDGYDLYAAHGAVYFENCTATSNGSATTAAGKTVKGDGNGFKLGGVDNKTSGVAAHLDPLEHTLVNCTATSNSGSGFDRNNQNGTLHLTGCTGKSNSEYNFNFPLTGTPSALGYKVTFNKAILKSCTSSSGSNVVDGATLTSCTGF